MAPTPDLHNIPDYLSKEAYLNYLFRTIKTDTMRTQVVRKSILKVKVTCSTPEMVYRRFQDPRLKVFILGHLCQGFMAKSTHSLSWYNSHNCVM